MNGLTAFKNTGLDEKLAENIHNQQLIRTEALTKAIDTSDKRKRVITIMGEPEYLDIVEQILGYISLLGSKGHSTNFIVGVDGDGSTRIKSQRDGKDLYKVHKGSLEEQTDSISGDIKQFNLA